MLFVPIICFTLSIPCLLRASNAISNTKTIAAVINTIVTTAIVLFSNCFGVGQTTLFNSALKSLKKLFLFLLFSLLNNLADALKNQLE